MQPTTIQNKSSLAVYVHVPFCGQRCHYCHFDIKVLHPRSDPTLWLANYMKTVTNELKHYARQLGKPPVHSVFLGGGTPSRLPDSLVAEIVRCIRDEYDLIDGAELTIEVNPEDLVPDWVDHIMALGINRISAGVQTFHDPSLKAVRRPHTGEQALAALSRLPKFERGRSIDLMLGLPFQNAQSIARDLDLFKQLDVEHVSVYMLETDLPTPLDKSHPQRWTDDEMVDMYHWVAYELAGAGMQHYEISNFGKPGYRSRHNMTYWNGESYIGVGPAAHGRLGHVYYGNHPQLSDWQEAVAKQGAGQKFSETWSPDRLAYESLIQGLRLADGVNVDQFSSSQTAAMLAFQGQGFCALKNKYWHLTRAGWLVSNEIFIELAGAQL